MNPSLTLTGLLALGLLAHVALKLWLQVRQVRHVAAHRGAVPAAYAETVSLAAHHKAADYTLAKARLAQWDILLDALVLLGWTLLGGLDALNRWLLDAMGPGLAQQLALVLGFVLVGAVLGLPFSLLHTFGVEQRFGFNTTTPALWLQDAFKGLLLSALLGVPLLALVLWLMQEAGALWWLWVWGVLMLWQVVLMALGPTLIMPLFNRFTPLQDEALKAQVQVLMAKAGFSAKGFFVMDGSRRSAHSNAFFTGWGASKRVVFFDTLLQQLSPAQMLAVLAHELGHFKHRHLPKMMAVNALSLLLGLALLGCLSQQVWFYTGLGVSPSVDSSNNALALLLLLLVVPVFTFFLAPLAAWRSRVQEFEADAYAAAHTPPADLAGALLRLYQDNAATLTPDPWFVRFYASHPPGQRAPGPTGVDLNRATSPGAGGALAGLRHALVVASFGRHCLIETDSGERLIAHPRGKKNQAVVGDGVLWQASGDEASIERLQPRRNLFYRQDDIRTKSFAANLDRVLILIAAEPEFSESQLSRALLAAEAAGIAPLIALNKRDLQQPFAQAWERLAPYRAMAYPVLPLALTVADDGLPALVEALRGAHTLVLGPSGSGKSTLINRLVPQAQALTGEISQALNSGKHTTTSTRWYWASALDAPAADSQPVRRGALIDSPGFQEFGLHHIEPTQLAQCMPDVRQHLGRCKFYNCTHLHEPGCAVLAQVGQALDCGGISERRHRIYAQLFAELSQQRW